MTRADQTRPDQTSTVIRLVNSNNRYQVGSFGMTGYSKSERNECTNADMQAWNTSPCNTVHKLSCTLHDLLMSRTVIWSHTYAIFTIVLVHKPISILSWTLQRTKAQIGMSWVFILVWNLISNVKLRTNVHFALWKCWLCQSFTWLTKFL